MKKTLSLSIFFVFISSFAYSQLSIKDFKLCLDNVNCTDTVLYITKAELLKSKKVIPNFSWFTIDYTTVYFSLGKEGDDVTAVSLPKDEFTDESRKRMKLLNTNGIVVIQVKGHNKQNKPVDWGTLFIKIVEK